MQNVRSQRIQSYCTCTYCHSAEYCSRGSLFDCLAAALQHPEAAAQLTWRRRLCMAIDAATGLLYLHGRSIIHRDGAWGCGWPACSSNIAA